MRFLPLLFDAFGHIPRDSYGTAHCARFTLHKGKGHFDVKFAT